MDERVFSVLFLLMAGVLPLRELSANWAGRAERRGAVKLLWIAYALMAMAAVIALFVVGRQEDRVRPPPATGSEQLASASTACAGGAPRA
ncbi:MAG: hypothetical protein KY446_12165 [Proteobacteria bacterium]|nr:hypothetical protein [Pseudomonadota bacterium]